MAENLPLLQIDSLQIGFESEGIVTTALQQISFSVNRGETVAIVGESGSGKSITSLSVLGLLPSPPARFQNGRILFSKDGRNSIDLLQATSQEIRAIRGKDIAMIFQEPMTSLNPVFTCGDQVSEAITLHRGISKSDARMETIRLFQQVRLPDPANIYDRYPHQLSGGQKQRVMIAMAICCGPALLIADEPTTALDVTVQKTILELIRELQQQSTMGVIFITHDLGIVSEIADRIIVMYKGRMVESGDARSILHTPQHPYTRGLLACRPQLHKKGERLPVVSDFLSVDAQGSFLEKDVKIYPSEPKKAPASEELLSVTNLEVQFPGKRNFLGRASEFVKAVNDVSFTVLKGETLGLVGESGCGKSTLGRAVLGLIKPSAGEVRFRGQTISDFDEAAMRRLRPQMQLIFQDPYSSLNPRLPVGQAILEPMNVHKLYQNDQARKEKVVELLKKVDLKPEHYNRYPHQFSGGQRQRIVIARALGLNPSFIICDESVSSLDVSVQAQVLNLLNELKLEFGFTVVFISHDLSVVRYISDRIMVMQKGKIIESGNSEEIYLHPKNDYTKKLLSAVPKIN